MLVRVVWLPVTVLSLSLGCSSDNRNDEAASQSSDASQGASTNPTSDPLPEEAHEGVTIKVQGSGQEIRDRNETMLARLREEETARKAEAMSTEIVASTEADISQTADEARELLPEAKADEKPEKPPQSSMEELRDRAAEFEPRMGEISKTADLLDDNYRRYIDACYQKYATAESSGSFSGRARGYSQGAAVGRDWFVVYGAETDMAYSGGYSESTAVSNETTAYCRELWSDIVDGSREVNQAVKALQQDARRKGVLPGHLRDLRRKYRLDWEGWTR